MSGRGSVERVGRTSRFGGKAAVVGRSAADVLCGVLSDAPIPLMPMSAHSSSWARECMEEVVLAKVTVLGAKIVSRSVSKPEMARAGEVVLVFGRLRVKEAVLVSQVVLGRGVLETYVRRWRAGLVWM